ncbi:response regulator [Elusimicrobiota bacterium]
MAKGRILIVDDTKIVCLAVEAELNDAGFEAESAYSGDAAIEKAKAKSFDMAFVDLVMPGMDGVDTCRKLKEVSPGMKVALISGHPAELEGKKDQFIAAGGSDKFLRKPFMDGEVVEVATLMLS